MWASRVALHAGFAVAPLKMSSKGADPPRLRPDPRLPEALPLLVLQRNQTGYAESGRHPERICERVGTDFARTALLSARHKYLTHGP